MKTTTENNKLIANFMEFKGVNKCVRDESGKYYDYHANHKFSCIKEQEIQIESENGVGLVEQDYLFIEDLKFHSDWNWLMEVINKIKSLDVAEYTLIYAIDDYLIQIELEATYNACAQFIKWYNQQNK